MSIDGVQGADYECEHSAADEKGVRRTGHHTRLHLDEGDEEEGAEDVEEDGEDGEGDEEEGERG